MHPILAHFSYIEKYEPRPTHGERKMWPLVSECASCVGRYTLTGELFHPPRVREPF